MAEMSYSIKLFLNMPKWQSTGAEKSRAYSNYKIKKFSKSIIDMISRISLQWRSILCVHGVLISYWY